MSPTKRAPKRNVLIRRARREAEHRRHERSFWGIFFFGWIGALYAWFTNTADRAQGRRFEALYRRRRDPTLEDLPENHAPGRRPLAAPQPRERHERDMLRRAARRRRLLWTVVVVGALLLLNIAYFWLRMKLRG